MLRPHMTPFRPIRCLKPLDSQLMQLLPLSIKLLNKCLLFFCQNMSGGQLVHTDVCSKSELIF